MIEKVVFYNEYEGETYFKEIDNRELRFILKRCDDLNSLHEFLDITKGGWKPQSFKPSPIKEED